MLPTAVAATRISSRSDSVERIRSRPDDEQDAPRRPRRRGSRRRPRGRAGSWPRGDRSASDSTTLAGSASAAPRTPNVLGSSTSACPAAAGEPRPGRAGRPRAARQRRGRRRAPRGSPRPRPASGASGLASASRIAEPLSADSSPTSPSIAWCSSSGDDRAATAPLAGRSSASSTGWQARGRIEPAARNRWRSPMPVAPVTARVDPVVAQAAGVAPGADRVRVHAEHLGRPRDASASRRAVADGADPPSPMRAPGRIREVTARD